MKHALPVVIALVIFTADTFAQQPAPQRGESYKYRTILTLAGAGGGFTLGVFAGLSAFDDAINSDRKVWTTAVISAGGGAVAGYFLGRALDKRKKKAGTTNATEELNRALISSRSSAATQLIASSPPGVNLPTLALSPPPRKGFEPILPIVADGVSPDLSRTYVLAALRKMSTAE